VEIGEGALEGADPASGEPCEVAFGDLVEPAGVALVDALDEPADERLVSSTVKRRSQLSLGCFIVG
jgi:hypothetical protein